MSKWLAGWVGSSSLYLLEAANRGECVSRAKEALSRTIFPMCRIRFVGSKNRRIQATGLSGNIVAPWYFLGIVPHA
jgi:hypothetical protein